MDPLVISGRTVGDLDDVADAIPVATFEATAVELKPQLVTDGEPNLAALELGHAKPGNALLVETDVPANDDVVLRLRLLDLLVVVSFNLDERAKDVLVLVGVLVPEEGGLSRWASALPSRGDLGSLDILEQNWLRLLVDTCAADVLKICVRVVLPHLLELVDLVEADLARAQLLLLGRHLDEPREEGPVVDDGRPLRSVPDDVLGGGHRRAWLTTEEDDDRVALGRDEAEHENVLAAAVVALGRRLAEGRFGVKHDLAVLSPNEVVDNVRSRCRAAGVAEPLVAEEALASGNRGRDQLTAQCGGHRQICDTP